MYNKIVDHRNYVIEVNYDGFINVKVMTVPDGYGYRDSYNVNLTSSQARQLIKMLEEICPEKI